MKAIKQEWRWNPQKTYATNGVDEVLITPLNAYGNKIRELHKKLFAQDKNKVAKVTRCSRGR